MSFKRLAAALSVALTIGCAGENVPFNSPADVKFDGAKTSCLKNFDQNVADFFEGRLSDNQVTQFWNCVDLAVVEFLKFARNGDRKTEFSALDIARFLDAFFLENEGSRCASNKPGIQCEEDFLAEMMQLKKIFIGGSAQKVTFNELNTTTRQFLFQIKEISRDLNPHMQTIVAGLTGPKSKSGLKDSQIREAEAALRRAGRRIAAQIVSTRHFYSFGNLNNLVVELERIVKRTRPDFSFDNAKKYLPLMAEFKHFFVAPPQDLIRTEDWERLFDMITNVMGWTLRFRLHVEDNDWSDGEAFEMLASIIEDAFRELETGMQAHPDQQFGYLDLRRLLEQIELLELLPLDLTAQVMEDGLRNLAEKVLGERPGKGSKMGFALDDLRGLKFEIDRWITIQRHINGVSPSADDQQAAIAEWMTLLNSSPWPLRLDVHDRLVFKRGLTYDHYSMTTLNWQRAIIRLLMRGYADNPDLNTVRGLSKNQLVELANDWLALAELLGLFDKGEAEATANKLFMEANLFLPSSNGDALLDFSEAVHYLAFGLSGKSMADVIIAKHSDCLVGESSSPELDPLCLRAGIFSHLPTDFANFPGTVSFVSGDWNRWYPFVTGMEETVRSTTLTAPITKGELVKLLVLGHYIETFYGRFDFDATSTINAPEAVTAFPVFYRSLDEIIREKFPIRFGRGDIEAVFTYMFKYGKQPTADFAGALKFLNWRWCRDQWRFEADRGRIVQILRELNSLR